MNDRIILIAISSKDDVQGFAASTGSADLDKALDRMKDLLKDFGKVNWDGAFQGVTVYYPNR